MPPFTTRMPLISGRQSPSAAPIRVQTGRGHFSATLLAIAIIAGAFAPVMQSQAGQLDLKVAQEPLEKKGKKYGPYVGFFAGQTTEQETEAKIDDGTRTLPYTTLEEDGNIFFGIDIGYSWRTKYCLEFSLEFEAIYSNTEVNGILDPGAAGDVGLNGSDLATFRADLSYAAFMLNGIVTLDLKRFKPYIGFWSRFRPYAGAGIGGAQIWYRNQSYQTLGDTVGSPSVNGPASTPFSLDEFVGAYQYFGGLEFTLTDKLAAYAEFRRLHFAKTNDLRSFHNDVFLTGLHLRY